MSANARRLDSDALYVAIDRRRRELRISFREISRRLDISASTFSRLGHDETVSADTLIAVLLWLGDTDLKPYVREQPAAAHGDPARTALRPADAEAHPPEETR